jgi:alcohol dehydrogenase class IV
LRNINYYNPTNLLFGWGRISEIGEIIAEYGKRCLMVTIPTPELDPIYEKITKICFESGVKIFHFNGVQPNPTTENVNAGVELGKKNKVDVVLGVGGGSSMDTAKCISVGLTHKGEAWDYRVVEGKPIEDILLPIIAVSTTAGTGAEVTAAAVVSKTDIHLKYALYDKLLCPTVGLVDPELTLTLPPHITASTGWDAFCHSFEAFTHAAGSDIVDMHALEGMKLIIKNLPIAMSDGQNREAREALHWANVLGGLAINNSGVTLPHGMGMAIGGSAPHISHGEALAIMYPEINQWTWKKLIKEYATVGRMFNSALNDVSDEVAAEKCCDEMDKFLKEIGMWMNFKDKNVPESALRDINEDTFKLPDYENHVIVSNSDDVDKLLKKSYDR